MVSKARLQFLGEDKTKSAFKSLQGNLSKTSGAMGGFAAIFGTAVGAETARRIALTSDAMNALHTRVKTATKGTSDYELVWRSLTETVGITGATMKEAVGTFQGLARVREELGASNADMLTLTKTVQQLGVIGGSTNQELAFGLRQFNQAMANSHVRAEEFNSILENIPEVAARIAGGLDVSQGALRNMVISGELASKDVFAVLLEQSREINEEFADIPKTMGRASSELSSAFNEWTNRLDRAHGITESIAQIMSRAAAAFKDPTQDEVLDRYSDIRVRVADINAEMERLQGLNASLEDGFFTAGTISDNLTKVRTLQVELNELKREEYTLQKNLLTLVSQAKSADGGEAQSNPALTGTKNDLSIINELFNQALEKQTRLDLSGAGEFQAVGSTELAAYTDAANERKQIEKDKWDAIVSSTRQGARDVQGIVRAASSWEKLDSTSKSQFLLNTAANLTAGMATKSKKMFELNKAASLASTLVKGIEGVQLAFTETPGPILIKTAAAATAAAFYASNLKAIASTQFQGGGASGGVPLSGGGSAIPSQNGQQFLPDPKINRNSLSGQQITIQITGDVITQDAEQFTEKVVDAVRRFTEADGVIIKHGTTQAQEFLP